MAFKCNTCGDDMHSIFVEGKKKVIKCPLEDYYLVHQYLTKETRFIAKNLGIPDGTDKDSLLKLKDMVPDVTPLSEYLFKNVYIVSQYAEFYMHLLRFLLELYKPKSNYSFLDSQEDPNTFNVEKRYYNYLFMSGNILRDAFFGKGEFSKFKSISDLVVPSLVIYRLGTADHVYLKDVGAMLLELIETRANLGKPTWVFTSKPLLECDEIKSLDALRQKIMCYFPKIYLDEEEGKLIEAMDSSNPETYKKTKNCKNRLTKPPTGSYGVDDLISKTE